MPVKTPSSMNETKDIHPQDFNNNLAKSPAKKNVRFADVLGLELVSVKDISPRSSFEYLQKLYSSNYLICHFIPPIFLANFEDRLFRQQVCLQSVTSTGKSFTGIVKVRNIAFEKEVTARYTRNGWRSFYDSAADFVPSSSNKKNRQIPFQVSSALRFRSGNKSRVCNMLHGCRRTILGQ